MAAFKVKVDKTPEPDGKLKKFLEQPVGSVTVQAVYYSSKAPNQHLFLYDSDGDLFMYPIPGQIENKIVNPAIPTTVKLPLYYMDEGQGNEVVVFGELTA